MVLPLALPAALPLALPFVFVMNVFCSLFACEPNFGEPEVNSVSEGMNTRNFQSLYNPNNNINRPEDPPPVVWTRSGGVEGYYMKIINGNKVAAFEGIPYGEDTTGRRFRDPVPKAPWSGILQAKKPGTRCLQFHLLKLARITGSEHCLFLNIYTRNLPSNYQRRNSVGLPVIFWLHGGGGWFGSGDEIGPSYLLQEDVVLVSINYRLGILGFMSSGDHEAPGNYGLKDQSIALKWVSENIGSFGGDPNKIIAMGVSSGGVFAHLHMMSPLTKHLISGAISLSGSALIHWSVGSQEKTLRLKSRLAKNVGCPQGSRKLMECLRAMNPHFLINAQRQLFDYVVFPVIIYHAVVEPLGTPGAFLTDTPENLYRRNEVARIPWISSQTTDEADVFITLYNNTGTANTLIRNFDKNARDVLDFRYVSRNASEVTQKIKEFYLNSKNPRTTALTAADISEMGTDRLFRVGIHRSLQYHSRIAPTYAMRFGFRSAVGFTSIWGIDPLENGVGHGTDSGFYFNSSSFLPPLKLGTPSYDISRMLINQISNFAYMGEPLLRYSNGKTARVWKRIENPNDIKYLLVDNNNFMNIPEPREDFIKFWESLGLTDTSPNPFHSNRIPSNNNNYNEYQYLSAQNNWLK